MPDYHLYTIPIWDAFKAESECALCELQRMLQAQYLKAALGGGMMESDIRLDTNAQGFCPKHLRDLYGMQAVHPLSLMLHTHLKDVMQDVGESLELLDAAIEQEAGLPATKKAARYLTRGGEITSAGEELAKRAETRSAGCHICGKIDSNMERYIEALLYMWSNDKSFEEAFCASKGVCIAHLSPLVRAAVKGISGKKRRDFLTTLINIESENLKRIEQELEWFTLKFDYRNASKPWGNSRDAVPRAIHKLRGPVLDEKKQGT